MNVYTTEQSRLCRITINPICNESQEKYFVMQQSSWNQENHLWRTRSAVWNVCKSNLVTCDFLENSQEEKTPCHLTKTEGKTKSAVCTYYSLSCKASACCCYRSSGTYLLEVSPRPFLLLITQLVLTFTKIQLEFSEKKPNPKQNLLY